MALAAALCVVAPWARAEGRTRVVLLEAHGGSRFSTEILARLRGELSASDFELEVLPAPDAVDPKEAVQASMPNLEPDVVLLVVEQRTENRRTEEIWLSDRVSNRLFVQRVNADSSEPARSPRWVAVQAAELVRARLAETLFPHHAPAPAPAAPPPLIAPREPAHGTVTAGFGVGLLHGFHTLADTWAPMARLSVSLFDNALDRSPLALDARATLGVGVGRGLEYGTQTANVRQSFGLLEVLVRFSPRGPIEPFLAIGGGSYVLDVDGTSAAPFHNRTERSWSGLNTLGAGLRLTPFSGAALELDATLMDVWSRTTIRFGADDVVRAGAPIALFGLTAEAVF